MAEPIVIILQTFERTDVALRTIAAARRHLKYSGDLYWYIADDSRNTMHGVSLRTALGDAPIIGGHHMPGVSYGENANAAWDAAHQVSALTFWLEDDWELTRDVDLYPFAALLMEREDVGMVRLGYLNTGITARCDAHGDLLYWFLDREPIKGSCYSFTGHPSLRHIRYRQAYGDYPTDHPPGETEVIYAHHYRFGDGPWIVWPVDWPQWGYFKHIGLVKTENLP